MGPEYRNKLSSNPHEINYLDLFPTNSPLFNLQKFKTFGPYSEYAYTRSEDEQNANDIATSPYKTSYWTDLSDNYNNEKEWLWWWYNNPATQKIVKKDAAKILENPYRTDWVKNEDGEVSSDFMPMEGRMQRLIDRGLSVPILSEKLFDEPYYWAYYDGLDHKWPGYVNLNTDFVEQYKEDPKKIQETVLHELNHSIQTSLGNMYHEWDKHYYDRGHEIQSHLMNIRRFFGLHPSKRDYNENDSQQMIDYIINNYKTDPDVSEAIYEFVNRLLHTYENPAQEFAKWLNTYASNGENRQLPNNSNFAIV